MNDVETPLGYGRFSGVLGENNQLIDATIVEVNPGFEHYFGEPKEAIIGKSKFLYFEEFYKGHEEEWREKYRKVAFEGAHFVETVLYKPTNTYFEMNVSSPAHGEFITLFQDVTNKKATYNFLQDIIHNSSDVVFVTDLNGRFKFISPNISSVFGYVQEELDEDEKIDFLVGDEYKKLLSDVQDTKEISVNYEHSIVNKFGETRHLHIEIKKTDFQHGEFMFICKDITSTKNAIIEMEEERDKLKALLNTIPDLIWIKDPEGKYLACNHEFELFYGSKEKDIIGKTDKDFVSVELAEFFRKNDLRAINAKKALRNEEELAYKSLDKTIIAETTKTPFYSKNGELVGVLGIARDISARKQSESHLAMREEKFRKVVDSSMDAVVMSDEEGNIVEWNAQAEKIFGYKKEEIINQPLSEFIVPKKHRDAHERGMANYRKTGRGPALNTRFEITASRKDDTEFPVEMSIVDLSIQGIPHFCSFIRDLSEEKKIQQELERSEENFKELVNTVDGVIWVVDPVTFEFQYISDKVKDILGYTREEWMSSPTFWQDHVYEEDRERSLRFCSTETKAGRSHQFDFRFYKNDGSLIWAREYVTVVTDDNGLPVRMIGLTLDIDEQRRNLDELEKYQRFFNLANDNFCIADSQGILLELNPQFPKTLGYSLEELTGSSFLDLVHPDDLQPTLDEMANLAEGNNTINFRNRYKTKEGNYIHFEWISTPKEGTYYAVARDITQTEQYQKELKLRDENLNKFFENVHVGIAKNSMNGDFVEINPEFGRFTGYTVEELNNMSYWDLTPEKYASQEEEQIKSLTEQGRYGPYQKEYITKSGDTVPVLLNGVKTIDAEGNEFIWSVVQDISESEEYKEQLKQDIEKFKVLLDTGQLIAFEVDLETDQLRTIREKVNIDNSAFPIEDIKNFSDFFSRIKSEHQSVCMKKMEKLTAGEFTDFSCDFQIDKGDRYYWHKGIISILDIDQTGKIKKVFITLRNIDDEKNQEVLRLKSQEKERLRIARDIHDSIGQMLVGTRMTLKTQINKYDGLDEIDDLLHDMIKESRMIINNFGISVEVSDLKHSFETLAEKMGKVYPGNIEINWKGKSSLEDLKLATYFFRIYQEALSNAIKYSESPEITVNINNNSQFHMDVIDQGIGFDMNTIDKGFGMINMKERATEINYLLQVESKFGKGTCIRVRPTL